MRARLPVAAKLLAMVRGTYFGNGVYVTPAGVLHVEFFPPSGLGAHAAKSFRDSIDEAVAFAERTVGMPLSKDATPASQKPRAPN